MSIRFFLLISAFIAIGALTNSPARAQEPVSVENAIVIENKDVFYSFASKNGVLTRAFNKKTNRELITHPENGGPFRIYYNIQKDTIPHPNDTFWNDKFAEILDTRQFALKGHKIEGEKIRTLTLVYVLEEKRLEVEVKVILPEAGDYSDWSLSVKNLAESPTQLAVGFPYLNGVQAGPSLENNVLITGKGITPIKEINKSRDKRFLIYGGNLTMQWLSQYNTLTKEGVFIFIKDDHYFAKKMDGDLDDAGAVSLFTTYFPRTLKGGETLSLPMVSMGLYQGSWKQTASAYRQWFLDTFKILPTPEWLKEGKYVFANVFKRGPVDPSIRSILNYENLPLVFDMNKEKGASIVELRGFSKFMPAEGDYDLLDSYGGPAAFQKGVKEIQAHGGKVILYVEGFIVVKWCALAESGKAREWAISDPKSFYQPANKLGNLLNYHGYWHECSAAEGWQDYLAQTCARLMRETGADGIRLDSLGCTESHACYNPDHHHSRPDIWNEGVVEILKKVRTAITAVKKDAVLLTESGPDFYYQYCEATLNPNSGSSEVWRAVFPEFCYKWDDHKNEESPLICNKLKPSALKIEKQWEFAKKQWSDALINGKLEEDKCTHDGGPKTLGTLHKSGTGTYYLVTAVNPDAENRPLTISLHSISEKISKGYLHDLKKLSFTEIPLKKTADGYAVQGSFPEVFQIILPLTENLAWLQVTNPEEAFPGDSITFSIESKPGANTFSGTVEILNVAPAQEVKIPGTVSIKIPDQIKSGSYTVQFKGPTSNVLGTERNLKINNPVEVSLNVTSIEYQTLISVHLKNLTNKSQNCTLELQVPPTWSVAQKKWSMVLSPSEEKDIKTTADPGTISTDDSMFVGKDRVVLHVQSGTATDQKLEYPLIYHLNYRYGLIGREETFIRKWLVCGPFPNPGAKNDSGPNLYACGPNFDTDFLSKSGGEEKIIPAGGQTFRSDLKNGEIDWKKVELPKYTLGDITAKRINWKQYQEAFTLPLLEIVQAPDDKRGAIVYASTVINVEEETTAVLRLGFSSGLKLWVNNQFIWSKDAIAGTSLDQYSVEISLKKGRNVLLFKTAVIDWKKFIGEPGPYTSTLIARLTKVDGSPLPFTSDF